MKLDFSGAKDLEKALHELKSTTAKSVARRVLKKAAQPVADAAAILAPVRTEALKNSIEVSTKLNKSQRIEAGANDPDETKVYVGPSCEIGKGGRHGHLLEFGTYKMSAQPFMRPAWEASKDAALKDVTEGMREEVSKSVARARRKAARG